MLICYRETTSHSPPNCRYGQKMVNHAGKQKSAWRILRNNVRKRRPWCFFFFTRTLLQWNVMLHRTMFLTKKCLLSTLLVRGVVRYAKLRGKRSSPFCKQAVRQTNLQRNDYIKMMLSQTSYNFNIKLGILPFRNIIDEEIILTSSIVFSAISCYKTFCLF